MSNAKGDAEALVSPFFRLSCTERLWRKRTGRHNFCHSQGLRRRELIC